MKAFFLTFLLVYLSLFPSASPQPIVEIYEEIVHLVHEKKTIPDLVFTTEIFTLSGFSEILFLSPQFNPNPELRPPELIFS